MLACLCAISAGAAQDSALLIRMLREGQTFKVRARAAMELGHMEADAALAPLQASLHDRHAAVRTASARALAELGDPRALAELHAVSDDRSATVRREVRRAIDRLQPTAVGHDALELLPRATRVAWRRVRYAVIVGDMRNQSRVRDTSLPGMLAAQVKHTLGGHAKLFVVSPAELTASLESDLERRKLRRFRVEGTLNDVQKARAQGQLSIRCEVSLLLLDEPARNLRSVLKGAATGVESHSDASAFAQNRRLTRRALDGAVRSALSNAWAAFEGTAGETPASRKL